MAVDSKGKPSVVQVESPSGETGTSQPIEEGSVVKETNGNTGETCTTKTGEQEVAAELAVIAPVIIRKIPEVKSCNAASVKSTESAGDIAWKTAVYTCEKKTIQVTTTINTQTGEVVIVDKKERPAVETGVIPEP